MNTVRLVRQQTSDQGTFGRIAVGGQSWFTGELPWRDNRSDISCIPSGLYQAKLTYSPRFRAMLYELTGVPGRFACRIHPANLMGDKSHGYLSQLNGCIALGKTLGWMEGQRAVLISRPAVAEFTKALDSAPFLLEVSGCGI